MVFCVFLFVQPAFQDYDDLIDMELLSPNPTIEKAHSEDMAPGVQGNCQALKSNLSVAMRLLPVDPSQLVLHGLFPNNTSSQQASVLRC